MKTQRLCIPAIAALLCAGSSQILFAADDLKPSAQEQPVLPAMSSSPGISSQQKLELERQLDTVSETLGQYHPTVVSAREHLRQLLNDGYEGMLTGIGVALAEKNGHVVIGQVLPGSPAALAHAIKPGQRILSVAEANGPEVDTTRMGVSQLAALLRGVPGTIVKVMLEQESKLGPKVDDVSLRRATLDVKPASPNTPRQFKPGESDPYQRVDPNGRSSSVDPMTGGLDASSRQTSMLERQRGSLTKTLGSNHPTVAAARSHLRQSMDRKDRIPHGERTKIPSIVTGRLLDQDGKPIGQKTIAFVMEGSTTITEGPTSGDGTFLFELPVDHPWQAVLMERGKLSGLRSDVQTTPIADSTSGEPNYDLELRVEGKHLRSQLALLTPHPVRPDEPSAPKEAMVDPFGGRASGVLGSGNAPLVRVYALGGASDDDDGTMKRVQELVGVAIDMAENKNATPPKLEFRPKSRALIAKASAWQHEIIEQAIKVLKENESQPVAAKRQ